MRPKVSLPIMAILIIFCSTVKSDPNETEIIMEKLAKYGSFSQEQLTNGRAILNACHPYTKDLIQLAYVLSTAIGESNIKPFKEYRAHSAYLHSVHNRYWHSDTSAEDTSSSHGTTTTRSSEVSSESAFSVNQTSF